MAIQDKFNKANTIYKITKDIDLGATTLTIPANCTLDFQGGIISNGAVVLNNTLLKGIIELNAGITATVSGTYRKGQILWNDALLKLQVYNGTTWVSMGGGALFKWSDDNKIQISYDEGATWEDLSPEFADNVRIIDYVASVAALPTDAPNGAMYMVGPAGGTGTTYNLYIKATSGWIDNGSFTSVSAGVVQTTGTSTTEVMSQDAVSKEFASIRSDLNNLNITHVVPLASGQYYTIFTAASAVELSLRKTGLIITFEVEAGVWQHWQYSSADTGAAAWTLGSNWRNIIKQYTNGVGGGTSQTQTATFKGNAQLEVGCTYIFTPSVSNTTANPTVNINGLAPVVVKLGANTAMGDTLIAGDIKAGVPCELYYNGINLLLMNPQAQINNALSAIKTQSNQGNFYGDINLANQSIFPYYAIKDVRLIGCNDISALYTSGVPKDLYLVYLRKKNISNATTIIQIGEKIGSSVGSNVNIFAAISDTNEVGTINTYTLIGNNGVRVSLTIDWRLVGESGYSMNVQVPIYTPKFIAEAESFLNAKKRDFWKNPTNTVFNYSAITRIEAVKGSRSLLYKSDGTLKELYLTYMRLNMNQGITNIIQISWKDGATVGVNNKIFATTIDDFRDMSAKPITEFTLKGAGEFAGLEFSMIVDLSLIPTSILSNPTLSNSLQLNTILFAEQLRAAESGQNFQNKQIVCFGDSVTEFGTYPEQIAYITGATTYKIGFGGCHLAQRSDSADYNQLGMVKIAESIASGDYTAMQTAVANLAALPYPLTDDNTPAFNRLTSIDFSKVDFVTIFFGTNDFTGNKVIGDSGSTDTFEITGAVNYIVNTLLTAYPNLKILFITPTHRFFNTSDDSDLVPNLAGKYLIEYCDAIISEARKNHIPALDMYRDGGLNKYNHSYYFGTDNVHPNATGYTYLANKFSAALNSLFKF